MMKEKERNKWLELSLSDSVTQADLTALYRYKSDPFEILALDKEELANIIGDKAFALGRAVFDFGKELKAIEKGLMRLVFLEDEEYPALLKEINNPPLFLRLRGKIPSPSERMIAVVGTRRASAYGKRVCEYFSAAFCEMGFSVVSGLARGIDTKAHETAIKTGGQTVAVIGAGLDVVYPPENERLARDIAGHGAVVSEYPMGTPPAKMNFPWRNRIISGMSCAVFVAEAPERSGALITASYAAEQGRDVWAAPGCIFENSYKGCHALIKDGARLVESKDDIAGELSFEGFDKLEKISPPPASPKPFSDEEKKLYDVIGWHPVSLDTIKRESALDISKIFRVLTNLQINGFIGNSAGGKFVRKK
ncbi:MAG: DNA-protecting protein DprA [Elusimicrobia bacterium CG03_land_8_20_14_0_80_50_18]|nr:MAG: DNA-protecting protein DprA [Elusimicrobia bacterium CG03_land_8_20_14_0_80_50_18]PIX15478.1 MAG: DNA-protecting protein DprA [Elusimicrobia bacterium CG_4_8_14_3_um_filter_50_9]